jgi:hypothetical protein
MAAATLGGLAIVALGSPAGVPFRLSLASACLAASTAYMFDDPAAATIAASPTSQPARRSLRGTAAVTGASIGWTATTAVALQRVSELAIWPTTVQFLTLVLVALAGAAVGANIGDGTGGAIGGVVVTMACYASTFLPAHPWLPFPVDPGAPGATQRLLFIVAAAGAVVASASTDPARSTIRPAGLGGPRHRGPRWPHDVSRPARAAGGTHPQGGNP